MAKLEMSTESLNLMKAIGDYIDKHDILGDALPNAASDVLDGMVVRCEVDDLVRRKLLRNINLDGIAAAPYELCGSNPWFGTDWTVELTQRAISLLWPDRATKALSIQ